MNLYGYSKVIVLLILFFGVLFINTKLLFQTSVALGLDGYYYVFQINSISNQGNLYFATQTPLILYFFKALSLVFTDTIFAIKIGAILLHFLLSVGVLTLISLVTRSFWFGLLGFSIVSFSNLHFYFLGEFLSNSGALMFLVWSLVGIVKFRLLKNKIWFLIALILLLFAVFSHRTIFPVFIIISGSFASAYFLLTQNSKTKLITFTSIILFLFAPFVLTWQPLFLLPFWVKDEFLSFPRMPVWSVILPESIMLIMVLVGIVLLNRQIIRNRQSNETVLLLVSVVIWSLLTTLNPFLNHSRGFPSIVGRLDVLAFIQCALAVPSFVAILFEYNRKTAFIAGSAFLGLLLWSAFSPHPIAMTEDYLQRRERLIAELPLMKSEICGKPLIIAQHGEQFVVSFVLNVPSQQKIPVETEYECVYWLLRQPEEKYTIVFDHSTSSPGGEYILAEDGELRKTFGLLNAEERRDLLVNNPHLNQLTVP